MVKYISVSISEKLIKKVDELIQSAETTYKTRADLIQDAIRIRLRELGMNI